MCNFTSEENTFNQAVLFNTVDKMLNRKAQNKLKCEKSTNFKNNISTNLTPTEGNLMLVDVPKTVTELHEFGYISKDELVPLLCRSVGKSCVLDPIPGSVSKDCIENYYQLLQELSIFHYNQL